MPKRDENERRSWVIDAGTAEWREARYDGQPPHLKLLLCLAPTKDGVAVAGVQVERRDGRAVSARDLRSVRLPPNWVLRGEAAERWYPTEEQPVARSRWSSREGLDDRHRMVWDLWLQAQEVAPRYPIRWLLPQLDVSDATARRWVKAARERAAELGWDKSENAA
jgi:hypothetical protein